jgi:hypothetical protein
MKMGQVFKAYLIAASALVAFVAPSVAAPPEEDLTVLYNNFNSDPHHRYRAASAHGVRGKKAFNGKSSIAVPFVPYQDGVVRRVDIALALTSGPNAVTIGIRADDAGYPGEMLGRGEVVGVPVFGTFYCQGDDESTCPVATWNTEGIFVSAGQRYWLIAHATDTTSMRWSETYPDQPRGDLGQKRFTKWKIYDGIVPGAFEVFGE